VQQQQQQQQQALSSCRQLRLSSRQPCEQQQQQQQWGSGFWQEVLSHEFGLLLSPSSSVPFGSMSDADIGLILNEALKQAQGQQQQQQQQQQHSGR
jgi:hypothetical protein